MIGLFTEARAARFLRAAGMRVLASRYRAAGGEIDLIARDKGILAFVEVKSGGALGAGAARVDAEKRARMKSAARAYMAARGEANARFDVLEESDAGFRLIRGAF